MILYLIIKLIYNYINDIVFNYNKIQIKLIIYIYSNNDIKYNKRLINTLLICIIII